MDEIILMRKLKRKDEWALGKIIDLYSSYITYIVWELLHKKGTANYAQTECQFRYCGTAIPFLTVRSTAR